MSHWTPLTLSDVQACLAAPQLEALRHRAAAHGQADPLPGLIADVTARVRAEARSGPGQRLESDPALLPPELKLAAAHLAVEALHARFPALALTEDQVRLANEARKLLERAARGELALTPPANPEGFVASSIRRGAEVLRKRVRTATGRSLAGL